MKQLMSQLTLLLSFVRYTETESGPVLLPSVLTTNLTEEETVLHNPLYEGMFC